MTLPKSLALAAALVSLVLAPACASTPTVQDEKRMAKEIEGASDSICSFCARIKRGILYSCARRERYNVLAMGQHLDDLGVSDDTAATLR